MKVSKKYPTLAYTIICIILLLGLIAGIKYIVDLGSRLENDNFTQNSKIDWDDNDSQNDFESTEFINGKGIRTKELIDDITSYEIDIPYGNVLITSTDNDPYITYYNKRDIKIQTIKDKKMSKITILGKMNFFNNFDVDDVKVNIYLPKDKLKDLDVDFNAGILKIGSIKADNFNLEMSAGNAIVKNCEFDSIETELSAGNLDLYTSHEVKSIDCDVSAGNMNLILPKDIKGFEAKYELNLGNISNNLSFNISSFNKGFQVNKNGIFSYGDKSCKIILDVSIGNISLNPYDIK